MINIGLSYSSLTVACLVALLAPLQGTDRVAASAPAVKDLLPIPKSGLTLRIDDAQPLLLDTVLKEYERVTGVHLVINGEVRALLSKAPCGLLQSLEVSADHVHEVVETLLCQSGCVVTLLHATDPVMLGVVSSVGEYMRSQAYFVPESQLSTVANHPALMVTTWINLEFVDVEAASQAMRRTMVDASAQFVVPIENTHMLILLGRGADVATRARMLLDLNEDRRLEALKRQTPPPNTKK